MRVHELAKELGISSKDLMEKLASIGIEAKNHMCLLDEKTIKAIKNKFTPQLKDTAFTEKTVAETQKQEGNNKEKPIVETTSQKQESDTPLPVTPIQKPPIPQKKSSTIEVKGKQIIVNGPVVVKDLAEALGIKPHKLITEMMELNVLASINQRIDLNVVKMVVKRHGYSVEQPKKPEEQKPILQKPKKDKLLEADKTPETIIRPPVVVFMGHVDHGKTSLLDKIRNTSIAKEEWGGITQHIGAYSVNIKDKSITFLDTPGHAAFTAMRARGANLTDIAVIVIDGVDGVMPQTVEAINHAKAAKVAIMVAINKIDLPSANPDRIKQQLQGLGLTPEDWGGDVICCPVSALTGKGIDNFLEMILLQAEMLELKANPQKPAEGFVVEAQLEAGKGPTATLLVKNGTLKIGDVILCDQYCGRVRSLLNDRGMKVESAGPSAAVKCLGIPGVPPAGAEFIVYTDEKEAKIIAAERAEKAKTVNVTVQKKMSLNDLFAQLQSLQTLELRVILKADTQGSVEAILHALGEIKSNKVSLNVIHSATGNITANDVLLASASNAVILGFNVGKEPGVESMAKREGIEIRLHNIIYEMLDQVRDAMAGLLAPVIKDKIMGTAKVLQVFSLGKKGKVAGCKITSGNVTMKYRVRVKRNNEILSEGNVESLKRFQDSVNEVKEGQECGIRLSKNMDFDVGDELEFYLREEIKQSL